MIREPRVFQDEFPATIQHRGAELDVLTTAVEPILEGKRGHDVLLYGSQGVGKTALARHVLDHLDREQPTPNVHVHCLGESTAGILRAILAKLPGDNPSRTTAQSVLKEQLRDRITNPTVVVLDEGDDLPSTDALSALRGIQKLSWIAICHDPHDWLSRVGDGTRHAVTNWTVGLDPYSTTELTDILAERRQMGLDSGVISDAQLMEIADEAAGIARRGIFALRAAARLAEERSHTTIQDIDVEDSFARARRKMREQALDSLPFHHHVCYEIVRRQGKLSATAFHERYDAVTEAVYSGRDQTPISKRERRTKLQKLVEYDLLDGAGNGPAREYQVLDASIGSPLDLTVPVP